jgi:site-specific DNA recombinase
MTAEEITRVVSSLRDLMGVLAAADPADKAQIYSQLGLALTCHPGSQTVRAEARPLPMYVRKCPRSESIRIPMRARRGVRSRRPVISASVGKVTGGNLQRDG